MRFGAYVFFMLGIAIGFMLLGKGNALFYTLGIGDYGPQAEATSLVTTKYGNSTYYTGVIESPGFSGVPTNLKDIGARFITVLTNPQNIAVLLGALVIGGIASVLSAGQTTSITSNLTSFAALYFVPIVMFFFFANMLMLPVEQYIQQANCPNAYKSYGQMDPITQEQCASAQMPGQIYYPILAIYNILGVLSIISFFKGGI